MLLVLEPERVADLVQHTVCRSMPVSDQPHPAAVASIVISEPTIWPSSRSGRSAIENEMPSRLASGRALSHSAIAWAAARSSCSCVSATDPALSGAAAAAVNPPSLSRIVTSPVPSAIVAPTAFESTTVNCSVASATLVADDR